ncbi:hypothetical protein ABIB68_008075 [Bradyrhizobium sp. F1.2.2]
MPQHGRKVLSVALMRRSAIRCGSDLRALTPERTRRRSQSIPGRRGIADRVQQVADFRDGIVRGNARRRIPGRDVEGALARVRVGANLHPAVRLACADRTGLVQHVDGPAAQRSDRAESFLLRQHRDGCCRDESLGPPACSGRLARVRDSEMQRLRLVHLSRLGRSSLALRKVFLDATGDDPKRAVRYIQRHWLPLLFAGEARPLLGSVGALPNSIELYTTGLGRIDSGVLFGPTICSRVALLWGTRLEGHRIRDEVGRLYSPLWQA